jgi:DNA invertase Pin-like site-specific DNA recombinase
MYQKELVCANLICSDLVEEVEEVGSGANQRPKREELMKSARRREVDAIVVWKLDRWGRSLPDLIGSLAELRDLGIAFVR